MTTGVGAVSLLVKYYQREDSSGYALVLNIENEMNNNVDEKKESVPALFFGIAIGFFLGMIASSSFGSTNAGLSQCEVVRADYVWAFEEANSRLVNKVDDPMTTCS